MICYIIICITLYNITEQFDIVYKYQHMCVYIYSIHIHYKQIQIRIYIYIMMRRGSFCRDSPSGTAEPGPDPRVGSA